MEHYEMQKERVCALLFFSDEGLISLQEYTLRDENVLDIQVTMWNPLDGPDVTPEVISYACNMGEGLIISAPIKATLERVLLSVVVENKQECDRTCSEFVLLEGERACLFKHTHLIGCCFFGERLVRCHVQQIKTYIFFAFSYDEIGLELNGLE